MGWPESSSIQLSFIWNQKNTKLYIACWQVDLQSSRKEKERLAAELQRLQSLTYNVDKMQRENQDLQRRLSVQETQQSPSDDLMVRTGSKKGDRNLLKKVSNFMA